MNLELIEIETLLIKLSAILGASFLIERFLVLMNELINKLFIIQTSTKYVKVDLIRQQLALDQRASQEDALLTDANATDDSPMEIAPNPLRTSTNYTESHFDVLAIEHPDSVTDPEKRFQILKKINTVRKEFWMQVIGTCIAIIVCHYSRFSIWIFDVSGTSSSEEYGLWSAIFTGIIIGGGSKPINFLMQFLINRKLEVTHQDIQANEKEAATAPEERVAIFQRVTATPKPASIEEYVGFRYRGGDRPERLENTHIFRKPVDLIVYHHTAMHSDAPYEALVKEFDRKGWLTGYNSVVFKDGTIRTICRWDRFGNHALPHNGHSLGIAFQGNFETDPDVPYSNANGKMGLTAPTTEQLDAAARVTALWALMHKIDVIFPDKATVYKKSNPKGIIPHCFIADKTCPGNNFPHEAFQNKVKYYTGRWAQDSDFHYALEEFKQMPFVYVKKTTE